MSHARYIVGDVFEKMAELPDGSVDLILTSPPFLALRSYLPADHPDKGKEIGSEVTPAAFVDTLLRLSAEWRRLLAPDGSLCVELGDTYSGSGGAGGDYAENGLREGQQKFSGSAAKRAAQGVGDEYRPSRAGRNMPPNIAHRLHDDGSLKTDSATRLAEAKNRGHVTPWTGGAGWPLAKSLALVPEAFRFALAYGINPHTGAASPAGLWRVRNVIRWVRPNPPVGALGDKFRPATSEMVVAAVSGSRYFDLDAVRSPSSYHRPNLIGNGSRSDEGPPGQRKNMSDHTTNSAGAPPLDWWDPISSILGEELRLAIEQVHAGASMASILGDGTDERRETLGSKTLRRLVESGLIETGDAIAMSPGGYKGAHYAVFPSAFVEPWIKAMSPERVCVECGEPSRRIVETEQFYRSTGQPTDGKRAFTTGASINAGLQDKQHGATTPLGHDSSVERRVIGERWSDCGHNAWRPGLVLDPFAGSGTTLSVATGHGRDAIGIDLDERNAVLARERIGGLFLEVVA